MRFRAELETNGRTATGFEVPADVVDGLGAGKRPPVRVTFNGHTYRSTVAVMGGRFMLPVSAAVRAASGAVAGDVLDVELALDTEPRTVDPPAELAAALDADATLKRAWEALSFTQRREHAEAIEGAKKSETRARRVDNALESIRATS